MKHVKSFEEFFVQYNASSLARNPGRKSPVAEVIQVAEAAVSTPVYRLFVSLLVNCYLLLIMSFIQKSLDPTTELLVMQKVISDHNITLEQRLGSNFTPLQIKKTVFYTGDPPPSSLIHCEVFTDHFRILRLSAHTLNYLALAKNLTHPQRQRFETPG